MSDPDQREQVREAAERLLDEVAELGQRGETETLLAQVDEIIGRLEGDSDLRSQAIIGAAMFNRGVALRHAGRTEAAVAALDAIVDRFSRETTWELRYRVGLALYNKGFVLTDAERNADAVAAFEEFLREFDGCEEPPIRERRATAMYSLIHLLLTLEQDERAGSVYQEFFRQFLDAPEPAIQQLVAELLGGAEGRLALDVPAGHAEHDRLSLSNQAFFERQLQLDPAHEDASREYLQISRELTQREKERAAALHADALQILTAYRERLEPFALFLRNFDLEGLDRWGNAPEGKVLLRTVRGPSDLETRLGASLHGRLPVLGIANPVTQLPIYEHAFPKLELRNETWKAVLNELVAGASLIVVNLVDLSSGVLVELRTIREHRRQDATLVVLSEDAHAADPLTISMSQVYDTEMKQSPRLDDLRVQLIDFPRVIRADEISFEDLASSPLFPDLLARAAFIQSLTVEQRQARQRAERLLEAVPDLIARNASELALSHLREALSLIRTLGDEWLLRRTHAQLGVVYYLQERFADAIAAFTEALRLARAAGDWAEEGLYLKDLGDCHRAAGAHSDAVQAYLAALEILGETSSDAYVDALRKLGGTYSEAADFERADGRFDQAFQIYEQAGQLSGMMEVRMEHGVAYFDAGRDAEAITSLEDAVRLARILGAKRAEEVSLRMIEKAASLHQTSVPESAGGPDGPPTSKQAHPA